MGLSAMIHKIVRWVTRITNSALAHGFAAVVWLILLPWTIMDWRESLPYVVFMSWYAIFVSHLSAIEAALAKAEAKESNGDKER